MKQTIYTIIGIVFILAAIGHIKAYGKCEDSGDRYMRNMWNMYECVRVK